MKLLRSEQSAVKNQMQDPDCITFADVAAIEWALRKVGSKLPIDEKSVLKEAEKIQLEWKVGMKYGIGTTDKQLTLAVRNNWIKEFQQIEASQIEKYIDDGYPVIINLQNYKDAGRDLFHNVLVTGYSDAGLEYKNSWGINWGDKGYGVIKPADRHCIANPCYIVLPVGGRPDCPGVTQEGYQQPS